MERRVLVAISLSFAVLFLYQALFLPPPTPQNVTATAPVEGPRPPAEAGAVSAVPVPGNASSPAATATVAPLVGDSEEREIVVETSAVRAVFTNRGARLRHWQLKNYIDDQEGPVDLVPSVIPPELPLPFSLRVEDPALTARLNDALYSVSGPDGGSITFELETTDGLRVRKTFALDPQTSGGLLLAVPRDALAGYLSAVPGAVEIGVVETPRNQQLVLG